MFAHALVIAAVALATAGVGSWQTAGGMRWYRGIRVPAWTPSGRAIGFVWTALYALAGASAFLVWNAGAGAQGQMIAALFGVNAFLNAAWSYLFFKRRQIGSAALEAALLAISVAILIVAIFPLSVVAALLLAPYLLWTLFATYLTFVIFRLNA